MTAQTPDPDSPSADRREQLADELDLNQRMEEIRPALLGYVASLTRASEAAEDIVQETQVFLWTNVESFQPGTSFKAWAFRVAYFKTMAWRRDAIRRGEVVFSESMTQTIAAKGSDHFSDEMTRVDALRVCLGKLTPTHQSLVLAKYSRHGSLSQHAKTIGKSVNTIHKMVSRMRQTLRECVQQQLSSHNL